MRHLSIREAMVLSFNWHNQMFSMRKWEILKPRGNKAKYFNQDNGQVRDHSSRRFPTFTSSLKPLDISSKSSRHFPAKFVVKKRYLKSKYDPFLMAFVTFYRNVHINGELSGDNKDFWEARTKSWQVYFLKKRLPRKVWRSKGATTWSLQLLDNATAVILIYCMKSLHFLCGPHQVQVVCAHSV